jgi:hypothetical protein
MFLYVPDCFESAFFRQVRTLLFIYHFPGSLNAHQIRACDHTKILMTKNRKFLFKAHLVELALAGSGTASMAASPEEHKYEEFKSSPVMYIEICQLIPSTRMLGSRS